MLKYCCIFLFFFASTIKLIAQKTNKADSLAWVKLNKQTEAYIENGVNDSALIFAKKAFKKATIIFGKSHICYAISSNNLADTYVLLGAYNEAEPYFKIAILIYKKKYGINHIDYAGSLNDLAMLYFEMGNYKGAEDLFKKVLVIFGKTIGKNHADYATILSNLAQLYEAIGNYATAEPLSKSALAIRKKLLGENNTDYAVSLNNLAGIFRLVGKYDSSEIYYLKSIAILKKILGEEHANYASALNNLAYLYQKTGKYILAENLYNISIEIRKKILGIEHPDYSVSLCNMAGLYTEMARFKEAENLYQKALIIDKKNLGETHPSYAISLNNISSLYEAMGNYSLAESINKQALQIFKNSTGENHVDYAMSLNNLGYLYESMGNYEEAEKLFKQSLDIRKNVLGATHADCAMSYNNLGALYETMGNYLAAENMYALGLSTYKKALGTENPDYAKSLNNLGGLYMNLGNYAKAESIYFSTIKLRKNILGEAHPDYATSINNLATLYEAMNRKIEAEPLLKLSISIYKKSYGEEHPIYASALNNLAILYKSLNKYTEAENLFEQALAIRKKALGVLHIEYASSLLNLANLYVQMNLFNKAENMYLEAKAIDEKVLGTMHPNYANDLNKLSILYYKSNNFIQWNELITTTLQTENTNQQLLLQNFSEPEKELFLKNESEMQDIFLSMLHHFKPTNINSFYQSTTAKQGWLLQGKQLLSSWAAQSKDTTVKKLYTQWQNTHKIFAVALQLSEEKRKINGIQLDSLQQQLQALEKQLINALPALQNSIANKGSSGKIVAQQLKQHEALIHWTSFKYHSLKGSTDSVLYAAFIITPNDTTPKFVTAFEESQLQKLLKNYHSSSGRSTIQKEKTATANIDAALYNLIWQPIVPHLKNATTIYNLPAGFLHKISFAALTDSSSKKQLIDKYDIHQLLSINELLQPIQTKNATQSMALFGGANYDVNNISSNKKTTSINTGFRNTTANKNIRFNYLHGTKTEVETVASNAIQTNLKIESYIGNNASEDNFKQLNGNNAPSILHIATHGFYFPPTNTTNDFPLLRSGLVLSGVNNYWGKDTLLENQEDGIVTAQEISNLNLLNTDLVVLSACQTALGDINGSEGVYGLQRAFKMAGVKKLLMSLWEVPDAETAELMQLFYSNVFKGDTYYTAFRKAQLTLKAKYKDPTKWAGFVLVGE
jgi:tetratricopeptide (TPR) repeat protein/CHAT domain-containing protein